MANFLLTSKHNENITIMKLLKHNGTPPWFHIFQNIHCRAVVAMLPLAISRAAQSILAFASYGMDGCVITYVTLIKLL